MKKNKRKNWRIITVSAVTHTHIVFRRSKLDAVAGLARRIFFFKRVVQGRSEKRHLSTNQTITPTHNVFRHSELDTVASLAKRIILHNAIVQGRSKKHRTKREESQNKMRGTLRSLSASLTHHLGMCPIGTWFGSSCSLSSWNLTNLLPRVCAWRVSAFAEPPVGAAEPLVFAFVAEHWGQDRRGV